MPVYKKLHILQDALHQKLPTCNRFTYITGSVLNKFYAYLSTTLFHQAQNRSLCLQHSEAAYLYYMYNQKPSTFKSLSGDKFHFMTTEQCLGT